MIASLNTACQEWLGVTLLELLELMRVSAMFIFVLWATVSVFLHLIAWINDRRDGY